MNLKINKIKDGKIKVYFCEKRSRLVTSSSELAQYPICGKQFRFSGDGYKIKGLKPKPYAIEYYCPTCRTRGFKTIDPKDLEKFSETIRTANTMGLFRIPLLNETKRLLRMGFQDLLSCLHQGSLKHLDDS